MNRPDFFLRMTEGFCKTRRHCRLVKSMSFAGYDDGLLVRVAPRFNGNVCGVPNWESEFLLLGPHYHGDDILAMEDWPMYVYVFVPLVTQPDTFTQLMANELQKIGFGVVYLRGDDNVWPKRKVGVTRPDVP